MIRGVIMNNNTLLNKERMLANQIEGFEYANPKGVMDFTSSDQKKDALVNTLRSALEHGISSEEVAVSLKRGLLRTNETLDSTTVNAIRESFAGRYDDFVSIIQDFTESINTRGIGAREEHLLPRPLQISVEEGRNLFLRATETDVYPDSKRIKGVVSTQFDKAKLAVYAYANGGVNTLIRGDAADYVPNKAEPEEKSSIDLG